jgi:hypothetical protein
MRAILALLCLAVAAFLVAELIERAYIAGYINACKSVGGVMLHTAEGDPICITEAHNGFSR